MIETADSALNAQTLIAIISNNAHNNWKAIPAQIDLFEITISPGCAFFINSF